MATNTYKVIEGRYIRDILDQPRALEATLGQFEVSGELAAIAGRWRDGGFRRVYLTGMGASFHALHPIFLRLNSGASAAVTMEASELIHSLPSCYDPQTLIIVASQSGKSAEVVRLIADNRGRAVIVGVTNASDSPLAAAANAFLLTRAGEEFSVSCKTYLTMLMVLHLLGGLMCGDDPSQAKDELAEAVSAVASYLRGWNDHVFEMAKELGQVRDIFLLGRGSSLAAEGEGALIIKESVRLHAEAMSGGAFRHGPLEMVSSETFAVLFAGAGATEGLQTQLRDDIRNASGRTAWIGPETRPGPWNLPVVPAAMSPLVEILPIQMMTLALAANAGIEAGRFQRVSKITTTE